MAFTLAASAEMLFTDLPFEDRVREIHSRGFEVEIWNWTTKDIDALVSTGATFSSMTGYIEGDLLTPDGANRLIGTARQSLDIAGRLGCPRLNIHGTGLDSHGLPIIPWNPSGGDWHRAVDTLGTLAELGEKEGRTFTLENLNLRVDHPGTPFATSEEISQLVAAVDSPGLRMNFDMYHAQIDEGNIIERTRAYLPLIGEIQVADVPGRCEPGTGELNYPGIACALQGMGYQGTVAMEAWASSDSVAALDAFAQAFQ